MNPIAIPSTVVPPGRRGAGLSFRGLLASLPDFSLAGAFLYTWIEPTALGEDAVRYFMLTMLLEFIIVHSSAFMGTVILSREGTGKRLLALLGIGLFYTLFVGGFALGFGTWWPVWAFWALTLNRMLSVRIGGAPEGRERQYVRAGWALSVMFYLFGAFATTLLPVPELGMGTASPDLPGSGLWVDEPHRVLAFGVIYFGLTGLGELLGWGRSLRFLKGVPTDAA